jgi:tRNA A-37 threonylcarbamoyl transferase component Bud32
MTSITEKLTAVLGDRYSIERELGEGGMATVYLAEDLKHKRKVAVKVLRPELAAVLGADRFVQEIETTASLQHPHILPLFDSGQADGLLYYVMPYIEGETLREKLDRETQLGIDEAVKITTEVADALDYAHRNGVIHRDIKPENILLHDGRPMVADFGIALAVSAAAGGRMTETGLSLGTPHYMSPEQATAEKEITNRSDIYSLACMTYEMLAGDPPHTGSTAQQIIMKIVTEEATEVTNVRKSVPPNVAAALTKALEKLPADRFESAADFAHALRDPGFRLAAGPAATAAAATAAGVRRWRRVAIAAGGLAAVLLLTILWGWLASEPQRVTRHEIVLGPGYTAQSSFRTSVAVAPDGSGIVYSDSVGANIQLLFKPRDALEATPLAGTEGGTGPFFSPDGSWIGFYADNKMLKVPLGGGGVITLGDANATPGFAAGAWAEDGTIYFTDEDFNLARLDEAGGNPEVLLRVSEVISPVSGIADLWPLPGDAGVLFTVCDVLCNDSDVYVWDARADTARVLFGDAWGIWYVPTGHVVYAGQGGGAFAAPFDLGTLTAGPAIPVLEGVRAPDLTFGDDGTLLYVIGEATAGATKGEAVWVERDGTVVPIDGGFEFELPAAAGLALSPDGSRLAVGMRRSGTENIWIKDLSRQGGPVSRLTFGDQGEIIPRWSHDGRSVIFSTIRGEAPLLAKGAEGIGDAENLVQLSQPISEGVWSPNGEWLLLRIGRGGPNRRDILAYRPEVDSAPAPLVADAHDDVSPAISPDGRWLAYASNESGRYEVYVRPFPDVERGRWQVSSNGGVDPLWAHGTNELYYLSPTAMMAAEYGTEPTFRVGDQRELFPVGPEFLRGNNYRLYDLSPDDQRFVMLRPVGQGANTDVRVVLVENWFEELKGKMEGR